MPLTSAEKSLESDLRSLMLAQGQTAAATSASSEISKDRPKPKKSKKQKKREMSVKKRRAVLKDPELYHALMRECSKEEKTPPHKDYVPPKIVTDYLVLNDVRPLKKKSQKYPKAMYYCRLCDYHCDTLTICISHIKDVRHSRLARMQEIETTLYHLPKPTRQHLDHLEQVLAEVEKEVGLTPSDLAVRTEMAETLNEVMQLTLGSEVSVRLFGSSLSGFGLKKASIDLDLCLPAEGMKQHEALSKAAEVILSRKDLFSNVRTEFSARYPKIFFDMTTRKPTAQPGTTQQTNIPCELSLNNHNAVQCSKLMRDYMNLDARVRTLGVCVKYWAHLCQLDLQEEGTLSPHSFPVMLVFFLQQETKPVLPCIHDWLESRNVDTYDAPLEKLSAWRSRNSKSRSELFVEFFDFYALEFRQTEYVVSLRQVGGITKEEKQWRGKKLILEDPFVNKRSLTRGVSSPGILDFVNDCFKIGFLYFGTVQTNQGPVITKILVPDISPERKGKAKKNDEAADISDDDGSVVAEISENSKNEEPSQAVSNLMSQLQLAPEPGTDRPGTMAPGAAGTTPKLNLPANAIKLEELEQTFQPSTTAEGNAEPSSEEDSMDEASSDEEGSDEDESDEMQPNRRVRRSDMGETFESFLLKHGRELTPKQAKKVTQLVPKNRICFQFDGDILTAGQRPPFVCTVCQSEDHLQSSCPDEIMPPKRPLPPGGFPPDFLEAMNGMSKEVMLRLQPSNDELRERTMILQDLTRFIRKSWPTAVLTVFGSSQNGFSFRNSDLDISLTFTDHKTSEDLNAIEIIEQLAEKMKRMKGIRQIQAITTAKVPIIKFIHYATHTEGDISLYNVLAQENTAMIRMYSNIDQRVKVLGYMAKNLAKRCDIGDASRGSLSSYAYILMLLHYLQQCDPPVIPCLQELDGGNTEHSNIVDGWNAWYYSDLDRLNHAWARHPTKPGRVGANRTSVTELWIGFLSYYAYDFDDKNLVVSVRTTSNLTKFEKMWNLPTIAIEDPFDLGHNLGAGLHRRMNIYIKKVFMKARERFGIPPMQYPRGYPTPLDYLWDTNYLVDGPLPNDRGCRNCGKIGHLVRDCPRKRHNDEQRKQRQQQQRQRTLSERSNESTPNKQGKQKAAAGAAAAESRKVMTPLVEVNERAKTPKKAAKDLDKTVLRDLVKQDGGRESKKAESLAKKVKEKAQPSKMDAKENVVQQQRPEARNAELSSREKRMTSNMAIDSHLTSVVRNYGEARQSVGKTSSISTPAALTEREQMMLSNMAMDPHLTSMVRRFSDSANAKSGTKDKDKVSNKQHQAPVAKARETFARQDSASTSSSKGEKKKNYWKEKKAQEKALKEERKKLAQEERRAAKKEKRRQRRLADNQELQQLQQQQMIQQQLAQLQGMMRPPTVGPPPVARPQGPPPPPQGQGPNLMTLLGIGGQGQGLPPPGMPQAPPPAPNPILNLQNLAPPLRMPSVMPPMPHFPAGAMSVDQLEASMGVAASPKRDGTPTGQSSTAAPPPGFVGGGPNLDDVRKLEILKQQLGMSLGGPTPTPPSTGGGFGFNAFGVSPNGRPTLSPFPGLMGGPGGLGGLAGTPPNSSSLGLGSLAGGSSHPLNNLGLGGGLGLGLGGLGGGPLGGAQHGNSMEDAFRSQGGIFGGQPSQTAGGLGLGMPHGRGILDLEAILGQNPVIEERAPPPGSGSEGRWGHQPLAPQMRQQQQQGGNTDELGIPEDSLLRRHWQP